jgi:predicted nucleic acid-binding protein
MACLETSFLIDLLRGKAAVNELKDELDRTEARLAIAAPSVMELWVGSYAVKGTKAEQEKILELIESLELLPLDSRSAREAGEIEASLSAKGIEIQTEDVMIAGIARISGEKVVTRDNGYGRIPGLKVLKY